jgi:hypothetical protein
MMVYTDLDFHEDKNPTSYVRWCIMIYWVETPSTPPFIGLGEKRQGSQGRSKAIIIVPDRDSISIGLFYKIYLMTISKLPRLWASWSRSLDRVG